MVDLVRKIEEAYAVQVPERMRAFYLDDTWEQYQGNEACLAGSIDPGDYQLDLSPDAVAKLIDRHPKLYEDSLFDKWKRFCPIALIDDFDDFFVYMDIDSKDKTIYLGDVSRYQPLPDEFIQNPEPPFTRQREMTERMQREIEARVKNNPVEQYWSSYNQFINEYKKDVVQEMEDALGNPVPERLKMFYANNEWKNYSQTETTLPGWNPTFNFEVFLSPDDYKFNDNPIRHWEGVDYLYLGSAGEEFEPLYVDFTKPECPVYCLSRELETIAFMHPSLDDFLISISTNKQ